MKLKLTLNAKDADATFVATYTGNSFKSLEFKRGKLNDLQFDALMRIVPRKLSELGELRIEYNGRVHYEEIIREKTLFSVLMDLYIKWYNESTGIKPKIDGIAGKSMNQIISYLRTSCAGDSEVIAVFSLITENWSSLDAFYQKQRELRQINSNINIILNTIKNGKSANKTNAGNVSNDFRESL